MTTHASILARKIPWTEEPGEPQSIELQRVGHDLATNNNNKGKEHTIMSKYVEKAPKSAN